MRWMMLMVTAASCASPRHRLTTNATSTLPAGPTATLTLQAPVPLAFDHLPCPSTPTMKGAIANLFTPLPNPGGAVISFEKLTVPVATTSGFSEGGALSLLLSIPEGNGATNLQVLRRPTGELVPAPEVSEPFMLSGSPGGLKYGARSSFWHQGVCEVPKDGSLVGLRSVGNGEVVGLREWPNERADVVLRRADGTWWSLGAIPVGLEVRPVTDHGRITLAWSRPNGNEHTVGAQFPDVGRTELVRRYTRFSPRYLNGGVTPALLPWGPSRFSAPLMLDYEFETTGALTMERPAHGGGFERLLLATLKSERGCEASDGREPKTKATRISTPALVALDERRAVVGWVEDRVTCRAELLRRPEPPSCPECPRTERPDEWVVKPTSRSMQLVLMGVDSETRELARITLPAALEEHSFSGVSLATHDRRLFVFAHNYALVLDQQTLEATW